MSQTLSRRERLRIARSLPALKCPGCGVILERTAMPSAHVKRCDARLAAEERRLAEAIG